MNGIAIWGPTAVVVAIAMEGWAALLHRFVWHGILWSVHRSHHEARRGRFERNDFLSALHAPVAIALILYGCRAHESLLRDLAFGVGIGMTIFGVSYALVHDGFSHRRAPVRFLRRFRYFRAVALAHAIHHQGKHGQAPFGFFLAPLLRKQRPEALMSYPPSPEQP